MKPLHLPRTAAAIQAFDAMKLDPTNVTTANRTVAEEEHLAAEVGRIYGEETADRNDPKVCASHIRPGWPLPAGHPDESFVRRMVRLYEESA